MKKLISLMIALVCILSFVACGGSGSSKAIRELEPSGEKIYAADMRRLVSKRQETYLEEDMAKYEEQSDKWFDVQIKMSMISEEDGDSMEIYYMIDGKMGFIDMSELVMDVEIVIEGENVSHDIEGNKITESMSLKGDLILVDGVAYVDITLKEKGPDGEREESVKQMGELDDAFDYADIEDMLDLIGDPSDYESSVYGLNITELLNSVAGGVGVNYYSDEDRIFIDYRESQETTSQKAEMVMQYDIEFEKNSAIVKTTNVYVRTFIESEYNYGIEKVHSLSDIKIGMEVKQISSASIKAPDLEGYEQA